MKLKLFALTVITALVLTALFALNACMVPGTQPDATAAPGENVSEVTVDDPELYYKTRYENAAFLYSVGHPDNWTVVTGSSGNALEDLKLGQMSSFAGGFLCCKVVPSAQSDRDYHDVTASFCVYKLNLKGEKHDLTSAGQILESLMSASSDSFKFEWFTQGDLNRASIKFTDTKPQDEVPYQFEFKTASYEFVRGSNAWKGKVYVTSLDDSSWFIICAESVESDWAANYPIFQNMAHDFVLLGAAVNG
jgi:hypothetical protein